MTGGNPSRPGRGGPSTTVPSGGAPFEGSDAQSETHHAKGGAALASVVSEIAAEADRLRVTGALRPGFEADLDRLFLEIAVEPEALAREAAANPRHRGDGGAPGDVPLLLRPLARAARRSRRAAGSLKRATRRAVGPRVRSLERRSIDRAGRITESAVTRAYVAVDHASRLVSDHSAGRVVSRLERVSPASRALPQARERRARRPERGRGATSRGGGAAPSAGTDRLGLELEDWTFERVTSGSGGPIVHVECGDARLVRRLVDAGHEAAGADPGGDSGTGGPPASAPPGSVVRAGALEFLGGRSRASLGGLVLSGVTERLSPGRARAVAHLAASRLRPGGIVVVLSAHERPVGDLVSADLSPGRPLHPITWCHLLSCYGLTELTINDPSGQGSDGYAIAGRKPLVPS